LLSTCGVADRKRWRRKTVATALFSTPKPEQTLRCARRSPQCWCARAPARRRAPWLNPGEVRLRQKCCRWNQ
jgi:hypothetical protein